MRKENDIQGGFKEWIIGTLAGKLVSLYSKLLYFEVIDKAGFFDEKNTKPFVFAFWHNRILAMSSGFITINPDIKISCLTSASKDGAIIQYFMKQHGVDSIRGSSSRRGKRAMIEMIKAVKGGSSLAITPDGPRGPKYQLNPGVIRLASKAQAPLIPLQVEYSHYFPVPKTWDAFRIPYPFSRVTMVFNSPINVPRKLSPEAEEELRLSIEETLLSEPNYTMTAPHEEYRW